MELNDLFAEAVKHMATVDFTKSRTTDTVSVFESTIRYIAGLLSAYELSDHQFPVLLQKATQLTDQLVFAWVGVSSAKISFVLC